MTLGLLLAAASVSHVSYGGGALDLSNATVLVKEGSPGRAEVFAQMLSDQVHQRTGGCRVVSSLQLSAAIAIAAESSSACLAPLRARPPSSPPSGITAASVVRTRVRNTCDP